MELHCLLSGVKSIEHVILLRLSGGAFAVYQQLSAEEKQSYERIKAALLNSGCSRTIVFTSLCHTWKEKGVRVTTISGHVAGWAR